LNLNSNLKMIEEAVAQKSKELEEKEQELFGREGSVKKILENYEKQRDKVKLLVGDHVFFTNATVLTSVKDSYFHGLLGFEKEKEEHFIARDPESFRLVLEYLTYGSLLTRVKDVGILQKVVSDAEYYLLPQLGNEAAKQLQELETTKAQKIAEKKNKVIAKFASSSCPANGGYWNWNQAEIAAPNTHFNVNGNTITFLVAGDYLVLLRVTGGNTQQGNYVSVYLNGADVARCYFSDANNYTYNSGWQISEVFRINKNDRIQIYHAFNGTLRPETQGNKLSIVML